MIVSGGVDNFSKLFDVDLFSYYLFFGSLYNIDCWSQHVNIEL